MVGMPGELKEHKPPKRVVGVPGMLGVSVLVAVLGHLYPRKAVVLDVVHGLQEQNTKEGRQNQRQQGLGR